MDHENRKSILIVEDDANLGEIIEDLLSTKGYAISLEVTGEAGLKTALEKHPDLIMLDILIPGMDGLEVLKGIRADEWGAHTRIFLFTNVGDTNRVAEAMKYDVDGYIIKADTSLEQLVKQVEDILS